MKVILSIVLVLLSLFVSSTFAGTYDQTEAISPFLEQVPYPYPTHEFKLAQQGIRVDMVYMDVSPEKGPIGTVLLFHGKNFGSDYWSATIKELTQAGYRVIAPDQVGFGKSSKPDIAYHFDDLALNTRKLLDHLQIKKVDVIANSMGGMLAVKFTKLYPKTVHRLILENPLGLEDYRLSIPAQSNANLLKLEMAQTEDSYRKFMKSYFPTWDAKFERFVEIFVRIQKSPQYLTYARASVQTYQMIAEQGIIEDLPHIQTPTLLIIGQKDRTVFGRRFAPPEAVKALGDFPKLGRMAKNAFPNAQLVEIEEAGHVPHLDSSTEFNHAVLEFLH